MAGNPEEIVLDASVAVKWFTEEKNTDFALTIRDRFYEGKLTIYAPDLIIHEVGNALRHKPDVDKKLVSRWIVDLLNMQLELIAPSHELSTLSIKLAFEHNVSAYDGTYIALAELLKTKLITDDERLYEKAEKTGRVLKLQNVKW